MNAFSQNVTDTSKIVLDVDIAKQIAVELVEGDCAKEKVLAQEKLISYQDSVLVLDRKIIGNLERQIALQGQAVQSYEATLLDREKTITDLKKDVKRQRAGKTVFMTTTGISVVALIISLII